MAGGARGGGVVGGGGARARAAGVAEVGYGGVARVHREQLPLDIGHRVIDVGDARDLGPGTLYPGGVDHPLVEGLDQHVHAHAWYSGTMRSTAAFGKPEISSTASAVSSGTCSITYPLSAWLAPTMFSQAITLTGAPPTRARSRRPSAMAGAMTGRSDGPRAGGTWAG